MNDLRTLEPQPLWNHFADLNAVPRASKKEERAIEFVADFGRGLGLETRVDETGNVLIRKPAQGREGHPPVALQTHLDMVHQKNASTQFDFDTEGIRMFVEGDWVKAEGTTLGSDNGIGVAAVMAVLESRDLVHPPLEALFTIDEETGMTGAKGLQPGALTAPRLLNLDSEDDGELTIGCAGGLDVLGDGIYVTEPAAAGLHFFRVHVAGLTGGHSGMDIHRGRGNANKLMNRVLLAAEARGARVGRIEGGGLRNAIPRESTAVVAAPEDLGELVRELDTVFREEHRTTDPSVRLEIAPAEPCEVLEAGFQRRLLRALHAVPHGIFRMSPDVEGLVQTSNNLASVTVKDGRFHVGCLCRGSVESEKQDVALAVRSALELAGADVHEEGDYPGWAPRPDAELLRVMRAIYEELFGHPPHVLACHAGLECGLLSTVNPGMEMISFGPNIRGAHSPDETVQISSVQKFWTLLTRTLERL